MSRRPKYRVVREFWRDGELWDTYTVEEYASLKEALALVVYLTGTLCSDSPDVYAVRKLRRRHIK